MLIVDVNAPAVVASIAQTHGRAGYRLAAQNDIRGPITYHRDIAVTRVRSRVRRDDVLATTVVHRDPGAVGAGADSPRSLDQVRPEPDGRLQSADTPEEHRTVRGV